MTNTQLLQAISNKSEISNEMVEQANKMLAQITNKNQKAKANKLAKANENDAPIYTLIREYFETHEKALGNELATYCKVSTSKVIALAKKMVASGELEQKEVKIAKIGTRQMFCKVVKA